ncbi:TrbI/VirB10 family protein [Pelagibius sp. Alg239-R121]|uniref:TrbI/VirB10 family protein n=1 Tax=Pelagibius sp. Alg239-R121 TaxID=2993448 RepID=UPI0024A7905A|nr:TrbI/VirB10 family protein [Pelagibius sp. Alg239-R121]
MTDDTPVDTAAVDTSSSKPKAGMRAPAADRVHQISGGKNKLDKWTVGAVSAIAVVLGGTAYAMLSDPSPQADALNLIPPAEPTPQQRPNRAVLFGDFQAPQPVQEPPVPDDPRFAMFAAQLEATQRQVEEMRAAKEKLEAAQPVVSKAAPVPKAFPNDGELQALKDTIEKMRQEKELQDKNYQRELAEMRARLSAQQSSVDATPTLVQQAQAPTGPSQAELEREEERQRRIEEERARLATSAVGGGAILSANGQDTAQAGNTGSGNAFIDAASNRAVQTAHARTLPNQDRLITQGTMIGGTLETAINSGLPGLLRARIKRDVWSFDGSNILVPSGSTLIGEYSSTISLGQSRVLVVWNRVVTPDGRSVQIGSRGTDSLGRAGMTGKVDHNFALKFEAAFLISAVSAIGGLGEALGNGAAGNAISEGSDAVANASQGALQEYLSIAPTINIDQGEDINVFVARDLYL